MKNNRCEEMKHFHKFHNHVYNKFLLKTSHNLFFVIIQAQVTNYPPGHMTLIETIKNDMCNQQPLKLSLRT